MPSQGKGNRLDASDMMMMRLALPCIVFFLLFSCAKNFADADGADWCYKDASCDAYHWQGECQTGKQQSPIDFNQKNTVFNNKTVRLRFNKEYMDIQNNFYVKNNGHTIQVQLHQSELTSDLVFDGDFLKSSYRFSQLHFHWGSHEDAGSEHTVDGNGYVAELHLVHFSTQYKGLGEAVASKDRRGLAVLGIFFEISSHDNPALQPIIDAIAKVGAPDGKLERVSTPLNVSALLPDDLSLWRYYGSLTTPSCNEVVHWTVFKKAMPISRSQWQAFLASKDKTQRALEDNNRPTQPTINRKIQFFSHVMRDRKPDAGEADHNPVQDDPFYDSAQKNINKKEGVADAKDKQHNGANAGPGGLFNSALTAFLFLSVFLHVVFTSVLRCPT